MIKCPKYKIKVDELFDCLHCKFNKPVTLDWKTNCIYPTQLEWKKDFIKIEDR